MCSDEMTHTWEHYKLLLRIHGDGERSGCDQKMAKRGRVLSVCHCEGEPPRLATLEKRDRVGCHNSTLRSHTTHYELSYIRTPHASMLKCMHVHTYTGTHTLWYIRQTLRCQR